MSQDPGIDRNGSCEDRRRDRKEPTRDAGLRRETKPLPLRLARGLLLALPALLPEAAFPGHTAPSFPPFPEDSPW